MAHKVFHWITQNPGLTASILAFIAAMVGVSAAWKQASQQRALTLYLDLFNRRLEVYDAVLEFIQKVIKNNGAVSMDDFRAFGQVTERANFLFPHNSVQSFLVKVQKKALDLTTSHAQIEGIGRRMRRTERDEQDLMERRLKANDVMAYFVTESLNERSSTFERHLQIDAYVPRKFRYTNRRFWSRFGRRKT